MDAIESDTTGLSSSAMIISLDLHESYNKLETVSLEELKIRDEKYDELRLSYDILSSRKAFSRCAPWLQCSRDHPVKIAEIEHFIHSDRCTSGESNMSQTSVGTGDVMGTSVNSAGTSPWNTTRFDLPGQELLVNQSALSDLNTVDPLNTVFSETDSIDWVSLRCPKGVARHQLIIYRDSSISAYLIVAILKIYQLNGNWSMRSKFFGKHLYGLLKYDSECKAAKYS
jgi:hypothetical protein